jgi:hypothetical protein
MKRLALILAASWLLAVPTARAGELDAEFGNKTKAVTPQTVSVNPSSELDSESPDQAWHHRRFRRGFFGFGYGYGFGYGRGYYGYGFRRGFGYGGYRW